MQAQIYKIHSDFYYALNSNHEKFVLKVREILKKQKKDICVGDYVKLSKDNNFIISRLDRINSLNRPKVSNIDLALVVCALKEPELNLIQLNRYLIYLKYNKINAIICFNKEDLIKTELSTDKINSIYKNLGYNIFFTSAKEKTGIDKIKKEIKNKTIVRLGMSGAGKTTLLNALVPEKFANTREISKKTKTGRHTTRHSEITEYDDFKIVDTPGFSCLKFDFLLPNELFELFDDLKKYKPCKFSNCLHNTNEKNICAVIDNLDKIETSRYESYLVFLEETLSYKNKISKESIKKEYNHKTTGNKIATKISKKKRAISRKNFNQKIKDMKENYEGI